MLFGPLSQLFCAKRVGPGSDRESSPRAYKARPGFLTVPDGSGFTGPGPGFTGPGPGRAARLAISNSPGYMPTRRSQRPGVRRRHAPLIALVCGLDLSNIVLTLLRNVRTESKHNTKAKTNKLKRHIVFIYKLPSIVSQSEITVGF
jgi:hypothetical protein